MTTHERTFADKGAGHSASGPLPSFFGVACAAVAGAVMLLLAGMAEAREVTDLAGRTVTVPDHVDKVILGEGRFLPALAILEREDPVGLLAGLMADLELLDPATYARYTKRFPALKDVPPIGRSTTETFSLEQAIALEPDVAIFGLTGGHGPTARHKELIATLEAAGVAIVFIDFRAEPLAHTPKSIALLGELLGKQDEAAEFNAFYEAELEKVTSRLDGVTQKPTVFLESRVGLHDQCCETMGDTMLGRFITWAGGENIAEALVPGSVGTVSVEHLLGIQPDVYVGTAIGSSAADDTGGRIVLGEGATEAMAQASLAKAVSRPGFAELDAVRGGRVHAIWHHFYNSPFNVAAVQAMAGWFHPDLFADVDARATLETFYVRFQPVPLDGTFWTTLETEASAP